MKIYYVIYVIKAIFFSIYVQEAGKKLEILQFSKWQFKTNLKINQISEN